MPPAKRKVPLRRQVLDLKGEDSSPRPTWQTKYQNIQSEDCIRQNGDSVVESSDDTTYPADAAKTNPLSGLVGSYNSDSENEDSLEAQKSSLDAKVEDFLKEIQSLSSTSRGTTLAPSSSSFSQPEKPQISPLAKWQQCYDHNSGYPYYWNTETNEVTWEMPPCFEVSAANDGKKLHQSVQSQQQQLPETSLPKEKKEAKKKVCKYPWEKESDSEDEKIEMITSFGPQSGEEDSEGEEGTTKSKTQKCKETAKGCMVGPQLPPDSLLAQYKKRLSESDDTEVDSLNDSSYETSCLLTYRVQDTGPPGDDGFIPNSGINIESETRPKIDRSLSTCNEVADSTSKTDSEPTNAIKSNAPSQSNPESHLARESNDKIINDPSNRDKFEKSDISNAIIPRKCQENILQNSCFDFADNVIAEIEKEMPPDYTSLNPKIEEKSKEVITTDISLDITFKVANNSKASRISGIALLANYEDDSEPEEGNLTEKRKVRDKKSNEKSMEKVVKPLFPCMEADAELHSKEPPPVLEKKTTDCEVGNIYESEANLSDSSVMHKAFKRKKRIEFATTGFNSSAPLEPKTASPDNSRILTSAQYNLDPSSNDHRGFGFAPATSADSNKSKYNAGWIQFVKTETINLNQDSEPKQKTELRSEGKQQGSEEDNIAPEEIEDAALLLKEKVTFLTEGKEEISPIQHIAIQLETLLIAWQQGALSNVYFCRWVKDKCSALIRHEKSAAPTGWTCLWDRKSKRYFYRNVATKVIQWDYPTSENETVVSSTFNSKQTKESGDPEGGGEEMELCLTPPHPSTAEEEKVNNDLVTISPVSGVSDTPRAEKVTVASPVTSNSIFTYSERSRNTKSKNKKISTTSTDDTDDKSTSTTSISASTQCEQQKDDPPLPPMPPPPPPDEPPPPPPGSPPPLPLDHDQPLPPGVDEPEYGMFRRLSPRQSLVKSQVDAAYSTDMIMTYGYAVQVQSNATPVAAISLQPVDYHGFVHDHLNTNHYVVQTAPASHVIHCPAKKSKLSLSSELDSFYSDIAMLNNDSTVEKSSADILPVQEQSSSGVIQSTPPVQRPAPSSGPSTSVTTTIKHTESTPSNGVATKKRKKAKLTPGLSMKKKGVSSLVAKWQQVQQEVRRDLNSGNDEDENPSNSNK